MHPLIVLLIAWLCAGALVCLWFAGATAKARRALKWGNHPARLRKYRANAKEGEDE